MNFGYREVPEIGSRSKLMMALRRGTPKTGNFLPCKLLKRKKYIGVAKKSCQGTFQFMTFYYSLVFLLLHRYKIDFTSFNTEQKMDDRPMELKVWHLMNKPEF